MNLELLEGIFTAEALRATLPMLAVALGILAALLADVVPGLARARGPLLWIAIGFAFVADLRLLGTEPDVVLGGAYLSGPATGAWGLVFLSSAFVALMYSRRYYREERPFLLDHDVLILCSVIGMMLMAGAQDLVTFFVGLELLSVPLYALAAFRRTREDSVQAGLKYFMLGAFAVGLFLYGAALLYAGTGSVSLVELREAGAGGPLALVGVALVAASLFFKVSVFPFHFWVPDVYQGAPTPVTAFMAIGTKAAGFAFLLNAAFLLPTSAVPTVAAIAILTLAVGNLGALVQTSFKRMLAYSGVAHAGTLLLVVVGTLQGDPGEGALTAALFYSAAYVFTAGGAFGLIALLEADGERFTRIDALRGLARRRPGVAAAMALFMLSLGGIPATGGFLGKYLVFAVLVRADLVALAVVGILLSVVALGYYLRIIVAMYMEPEPEGQAPPTTLRLPASVVTGVCVAMVLLLGITPAFFLDRL